MASTSIKMNGSTTTSLNGASPPLKSCPPASCPALMTEEERAKQREYWEEHSKKQGSSMENMMLDKSAAKLDLLDRPEVLSLIPPFAGQNVLELASGIGRFTGSIAGTAASVVTVEFMEDFLAKNRELNKHYGNIEFICADVLTLALPPGSFDLVFSCWIQMYLNDEEVRILAKQAIEWCKPGGYAFFRESCFRQSGDVKRGFNPSHYRHPSFYTRVFSEVRCIDAEGVTWGLELVKSRNLETYVEVKGNKGQICWLWRKVMIPSPSSSSAAAIQNQLLVTPSPLSTHDGLFGAGFGSDRLGGKGPTDALIAALGPMKAGERVVDWQCGLGGYGLCIAEQCHAKVWGVDCSTTMIEVAVQGAMAYPQAHTVLEATPLDTRDFEAESVEAVLIADATLSWSTSSSAKKKGGSGNRVQDICQRACKWLKPGGRLVMGLLGSVREGEEGREAVGKAMGGGEGSKVEVTDYTSQLLEWLGRDLESFRLRSSGKKAITSDGIVTADGSSGNGHATAAAAAADAALDEEAEQYWSSRLEQAQAGSLRYLVIKAIRPAAVNAHGSSKVAASAASPSITANGHHHPSS